MNLLLCLPQKLFCFRLILYNLLKYNALQKVAFGDIVQFIKCNFFYSVFHHNFAAQSQKTEINIFKT